MTSYKVKDNKIVFDLKTVASELDEPEMSDFHKFAALFRLLRKALPDGVIPEPQKYHQVRAREYRTRI